MAHPLDPLSAEEIRAAVAVVRRERGAGDRWRFASIELREPPKGEAIDREAILVCWNRDDGRVYKGRVSLAREAVVAWDEQPDGQPNMTVDEFKECDAALRRDPRVIAALAERGITDMERVLIDTWAYAGSPYANPVTGLHLIVDLNRMELLEIEDTQTVEAPRTMGEYVPHLVPGQSRAPTTIGARRSTSAEWGLGFMTTSLELGCDRLGEIRYLDAVMHDSAGEPYAIPNAICLHEEDDAILWKHVDAETGAETWRARRLVLSFHVTVANYEYLVYWRLYQDGNVDGERNTVYATESEALPLGPDNPHGLALVQRDTPLRTEQQDIQDYDWATQKAWKVVSHKRNGLGTPTGYKLVPGGAFPPLMHADSPVLKRARAIEHTLWVTPYRGDERWPCGEFVVQSAEDRGLPVRNAQDRAIEDMDVVLWYVFGIHHVTRPEEWPVMSVDKASFWLKPVGFFDRNPALDVPPSPSHCH